MVLPMIPGPSWGKIEKIVTWGKDLSSLKSLFSCAVIGILA